MREVTNANFGLLIAYVIPGFLILFGIEPYSVTLQGWLGQTIAESLTVAGFLFATLFAVGLGMLSSTARWLLIDPIQRRRLDTEPDWNFRLLNQNLNAFDRLIEDHFRYYQFHANNLIAVNVAFILRSVATGTHPAELLAIAVVNFLLFKGSTDTFLKYHRRVDQLLGESSSLLPDREEVTDLKVEG